MTKMAKILIVLFTLFAILMVGLATHRGNQWRERALKAEMSLKAEQELTATLEETLDGLHESVIALADFAIKFTKDPNLPEN